MTKEYLTWFQPNKALSRTILASLVLVGCSNETWIIHSKLEKSESEGGVSDNRNVYPIAKRLGNFFDISEVSGEIYLNNAEQYKSSKEENLKPSIDKDKLFHINVSLYQRGEKGINYLVLSNMIGYINISDGRVLKPQRVYLGSGGACLGDYLANYYQLNEAQYEIEFLPNKTCLVFEYNELVDSKEKFSLNIGIIKSNNVNHKLQFNFTPMIVKHTSH